MKWQDVRDLLMNNKAVSGYLVTLIILFGGIFSLTGVDYDYKIVEESPSLSVAYLNVTTSYWRVCFDHFGEDKDIIHKKTSRGRTLWVNLDNVNNLVSSNEPVEVQWFFPTYGGRWRNVKDGDCWDRRKVNKNKLVVKKRPSQEVIWNFELKDIDIKDKIEAYPMKTKFFPKKNFGVDYIDGGYNIGVDGDVIRLDYVDKVSHEKIFFMTTHVDTMSGTPDGKVLLNTPEHIKDTSIFMIRSDLPLAVEGCRIRYQSLFIDLCNEDETNTITEYEGYMTAEANTAVYSSNVVSVSGGSKADPIKHPSIVDDVSNQAAFGNSSATAFHSNTTLQINASAVVQLDSDETLALGGELNIYGEYIIQGAVNMNITDGTVDDVNVFNGGVLNLTDASPSSDYIPSEGTSFTSKIIGLSGAAYPDRWELDCDAGGTLYMRDASLEWFDADLMDDECDVDIRRVKISQVNYNSRGLELCTGDSVDYAYFTNENGNGGHTTGTDAYIDMGNSAGCDLDISNIRFNGTGGNGKPLIFGWYTTDLQIRNSTADHFGTYTRTTSTDKTVIRFFNTTFNGDGSADGINLSNVVTYWSLGGFNKSTNISVNYPIHVFVKESGGTAIDGATVNTSFRKKNDSATSWGSWTSGPSGTTGSSGHLTSQIMVMVYKAVYNNESWIYEWRISANHSSYTETNTSTYNFTNKGTADLITLSLGTPTSGSGATQDWSGGSYTGVAPNCSGASNITITEDTTWENMKWINLSCDVTVDGANFTMDNVSFHPNSSASQQYGMWFKTGRNMHVKFYNSTIQPAANFTFYSKEYERFEEYNWLGANGDEYAIRWEFIDNTFYNLGQKNDNSGQNLKAAGSIIQVPKYVIYKRNTYESCGNAGYIILRNTVSPAQVNFTNNTCNDIRHTCMNWRNGNGEAWNGGPNFIAGNVTCNGRWKNGMVTTASMCHYSANTINERLNHVTGTALGYSSDFVGPNTAPIVHDMYWYNTRMGDDFNKYVDGGHIFNCTYRNIEQVAVYMYGGCDNNVFEDLRIYNVSAYPGGTVNAQCIWLPDESNDYGDTTNNTYRNIICSNARVCIQAQNGGDVSSYPNYFENIQCNNISSKGLWVSSGGYVWLTKSNFTNHTNLILDIDSNANLTAYWNNFYDVTTFDIDTTGVQMYNSSNSSGNYHSNHTGPDADNDNIVDNAFTYGGTTGRTDPYPLAAPYNGTAAWMGAAPSAGESTGPFITATNKTLELGDFTTHDANATDSTGVNTSTWHVNDTDFSIDATGLISFTTLSVGTHYVEISVLDTSVNKNNGTRDWTVTVSDTTSPSLQMEDKTIIINNDVSHDVNATDAAGVDTSTWNVNDSQFDITTAGVVSNNTALSGDVYYILVSVLDNNANNGSKVWNLTIVDTSTPSISVVNQSIQFGTAISHDANATAGYAIDTSTWRVNDSTFTIDASGIITNATAMGSGVTHYVEISVADTQGNNGTRDWTVTITDTTNPTVDSVTKTIYETALSVDLNATDASGIDETTWTVNDTTNFAIATNGILSNNTALTIDETYYLNVCVNDTDGNNGCAVQYIHYREGGVGFNYTYGGSITSLVFSPTTLNSQDVAPTGQTASVPAYRVCNEGGTDSGDGFEAKLNASLPTGITMTMYTSNAPSSAVTLTTSYQYVNGTGSASVPSGACNEFWVWLDLDDPSSGGSFDLLWRLT